MPKSKSDSEPKKADCLILTFTGLENESRVLRQVEALSRLNKSVLVCAFDSFETGFPGCQTFDISPKKARENNPLLRFWAARRQNLSHIRRRIERLTLPIIFWISRLLGLPLEKLAKRWLFASRPYLAAVLLNLKARNLSVANVVGHDYAAMWVLRQLFPDVTVNKVFDCHEHSPTQYQYKAAWSFWVSPIVQFIEQREFELANTSFVVSECIASDLETRYQLSTRPTVLASWPAARTLNFAHEMTPKEPHSLKLLYLGYVTHGRGLEEIVKLLAKVSRDYSFTMQGPLDYRFIGKLSKSIDRLGLSNHIKILGPVSQDKVIQSASNFDVGIYLPPGTGIQKTCSLPNKFFEYLGAGLPVIVPNFDEMAAIVREFKNGWILDRNDLDDSFVQLLNTISWAELRDCARGSMVANEKFRWENQQDLFGSSLRF